MFRLSPPPVIYMSRLESTKLIVFGEEARVNEGRPPLRSRLGLSPGTRSAPQGRVNRGPEILDPPTLSTAYHPRPPTTKAFPERRGELPGSTRRALCISGSVTLETVQLTVPRCSQLNEYRQLSPPRAVEPGGGGGDVI